MNAAVITIGSKLLVILVGFAGGIAVGSGLVALLIVFDLIPRLAQLAKAFHMSAWFESAIISGTLFWTIADFLDFRSGLSLPLLQSFVGILAGIFVGMLAAALTEVMNVIPIYAKRLKLSDYMVALVMAMVIGKVMGSLVDWLAM